MTCAIACHKKQIMKYCLKITNIILIFPILFLFFLFTSDLCAENEGVKITSFPDNQCIKFLIIGKDTVINNGTTSLFFKKHTFPFKNNYVIIELNSVTADSGSSYLFNLKGIPLPGKDPIGYPYKEYTNVPPGNYLLRVYVVNPERSNLCLVYPFRILPPFYKTTVALVFYIFGILLFTLVIFRMRNYNFAKQRYQLEQIINERTEELLMEKDKIEELLANVLPKDTADEIKSTGKATKKKYQMATVLFSDIQGFTKIAETLNPEVLIDELDQFFFHFDSVVEKYNIEKIKTIGDAYMCAGGIPEKNRTNPVEVILAAMEMQQYMIRLKQELSEQNKPAWDIRIGIHTGSVIAGVIGHKKLSYDIWGDTVNTASRMESSGKAGKINISGSTYELVKNFFICEYRGKMPVKYKGEIDMYFVEGIRPELAEENRITPNHSFFIHLQMLRLQDLEEYILDKLENELSENLNFHNVQHTIHVSAMAELLGRAEKITDEEMLITRTASIMHDTGYLMTYENHEQASCDLVMDLLPKYKYNNKQIKQICSLILAKKDPYHPKSEMQKIMFDANYNFLSRIDFKDVALRLWKEIKAYKKDIVFKIWQQKMITLLEKYEFHTFTARKLRDVSKEKQINIIRNLTET